MLKIKCDYCGEELKILGALLFSSPNIKGEFKKYHFCKDCEKQIMKFLTITDKQKAINFLISTGIYTRKGNLTKKYK